MGGLLKKFALAYGIIGAIIFLVLSIICFCAGAAIEGVAYIFAILEVLMYALMAWLVGDTKEDVYVANVRLKKIAEYVEARNDSIVEDCGKIENQQITINKNIVKVYEKLKNQQDTMEKLLEKIECLEKEISALKEEKE